MANKPEFVDMISDATRQSRRPSSTPLAIDPPVKKRSRIARPSERMMQWRMENLTPWKIKPWKFTDWD